MIGIIKLADKHNTYHQLEGESQIKVDKTSINTQQNKQENMPHEIGQVVTQKDGLDVIKHGVF